MGFLDRDEAIKLDPAQILVMGFAALILVGATLLNLPIASLDGKSIGFVDALFTASSAVCVTGLVVVNTAAHWTMFGKVVILILIQIGGLGFMTMATMVALIIGKRITLKERLVMQEELNQFTIAGVVKLTRYIIISTLIIEAVGAVFLSMKFIPEFGMSEGIWFSIFHSISAFCNAGFDLIGNSMVDFADSFIVTMTISALVIMGGLGYTVYIDITTKKNWRKLSLHSKLVLLISGGLLLIGFVLIFILEFSNPNTLGPLSPVGKVLAAFFQSVVPRTAGFNSIDMTALTDASSFVIILLMFIGGSPSSTAGGVKTTTVGALLLGILAVVRGKDDIEIYKKRLPKEIVMRSVAVVGIAFGIVLIVVFLLTITEAGASFMDITFEAVSAFATVGLSRDFSSSLSLLGRLIITATMFVGRVGPLTMAFAFANKSRKLKGNIRYPEEKIIVG